MFMTVDRNSSPAHDSVSSVSNLGFVGGPGGARALLAVAGSLLLSDFAGVRWQSIGGISGGSLPTVLHAAGMSAPDIVKLAVSTNFASLLTKDRTYSNAILSYSIKMRRAGQCPVEGFYATQRLGNFFAELVQSWPKNFWTLAIAADRSLILFTSEGIFCIRADRQWQQLTSEPASIDLALCSTCAVPGIFHAVPLTVARPVEGPIFGQTVLFDGALGPQGRRAVAEAAQYFGHSYSDLVVVDVGPDIFSPLNTTVEKLWTFLYGPNCVPAFHDRNVPSENDGLKLVNANVTSLRAFEFNCSENKKWEAVMTGVRTSIKTFAESALLSGDRLEAAHSAVGAFDKFQERKTQGSAATANVAALLKDHGLL